ncbi:MAG: DUF5682 family protein [Oscillospiraceae bacterium]|nr:DUF5682 family protein [Oscillospiraceae bacterium]
MDKIDKTTEVAKIDELFEKGCDLNKNIIFFPIRHHSPACSFHLENLLKSYNPDIILIEGPSDTNNLIEYIGSGDNTAPICVYYSHAYKDDNGDEQRSSCYYPMLDFSPELVAIRYGAKNNIPTQFIDLPYGELTQREKEYNDKIEDKDKKDEGKSSYYDDYYLSRSKFIDALCKKNNCRNYGEFWERFFELDGIKLETCDFMRNVLGLCFYSRVEYPDELLELEGCAAREDFMSVRIKEAVKNYKKIAVVTGGFHTSALIESVNETKHPPTPNSRSEFIDGTLFSKEGVPAGTGVLLSSKKYKTGEAKAYLIPYSFSESDQLSGYASGMPYPAFYQEVYENLKKIKPPNNINTAFDNAVLSFLVKIGSEMRRNKENISIADEAAAYKQSAGLAELRGKSEQGVYELIDAVKSAYIKQELNNWTTKVLGITTELLRGTKIGAVSKKAEQVPLLLDFRATAEKFKLKHDTVTKQETVLEILTKKVHRETSVFFHRIEFLGVKYGEMVFGPDYKSHDVSRVREKWTYASSARVEANIVDVSYLGGTVREAASSLVTKKQKDLHNCGEFSELLIQAAVMDLTEHIKPLLDGMKSSVADDGSFLSLSKAAVNLLFLDNAKWLLSLDDITSSRKFLTFRERNVEISNLKFSFAEDLINQVYQKAVSLLPLLETKIENEDREFAKIIKELYQISQRESIDQNIFIEALTDLCGENNPPPCLHGSAAGLLYSTGHITCEKVMNYAESYFYGTGEIIKKAGIFLGGLFISGWDLIFSDDRFIDGITNILQNFSHDDFMFVLPDLRLAFSAFTPSQIDKLAGIIAKILGIDKDSVTSAGISEKILSLGREIDKYAIGVINK